MRIGSLLVLVWLLIGAAACFQRGYFQEGPSDCAQVSTIALTVAAGPLNYVGVNPEIDCPTENLDVDVPEPSQ